MLPEHRARQDLTCWDLSSYRMKSCPCGSVHSPRWSGFCWIWPPVCNGDELFWVKPSQERRFMCIHSNQPLPNEHETGVLSQCQAAVVLRHRWPLGGTGGPPRSREPRCPPEEVAAAQVRLQLAQPSSPGHPRLEMALYRDP